MEERILKILETVTQGWCLEKKALTIAQVIKDRNIKVSVEIGVYGGRSLFPQAVAHQLYTGGVAYGIDPYSTEAAMQTSPNELFKRHLDEVNAEIRKIDFEELYQATRAHLLSFQLQDHCRIIRARSEDAVHSVPDNIGLLHIDGNHGDEAVMKDFLLYFPKLEPGGILWFDDCSWTSVQPAVDHARQYCRLSSVTLEGNAVFEKL